MKRNGVAPKTMLWGSVRRCVWFPFTVPMRTRSLERRT
jgi:hypothetical protein